MYDESRDGVLAVYLGDRGKLRGIGKTHARLYRDADRAGGEDIRKDEVLEKHADWVDEFLPKYAGQVNEDTIMDILQKEVGIVFGKVLEHAGVYKRNAEGAAAFDRFINALDERN